MRTFVDATTGVTVTALTTGTFNDAKIYQTHPQWTADGQYVIFRSNRAAGGRSQAFAVREATGDIIQLTEGATNTGSLNVAANRTSCISSAAAWGRRPSSSNSTSTRCLPTARPAR